MIVSPFTPLFFIDRKADGIDSEYIQTFASYDRVLLQIIADQSNMTPVAAIVDKETDEIVSAINFLKWEMSAGETIYFAYLTFSPGLYSVRINGIGESDIFRVTSDNGELENTTLIQYSMRNNRQRRDAAFFINGMQHFFSFRVPGGFKDSNWTFGTESEQFVTPSSDISQLYGLESTVKKFTLGTGIGVPVWFAEMLNRILVCTYVYFDGIRYCRKDSSVPEMSVQLEGVNSFVFTQMVQQIKHISPRIQDIANNMVLRRADGNAIRSVGNATDIFRNV